MSELNPFEPPKSDVAQLQSASFIDASRGRRFGTFVVDYVGYILTSAICGGALGVAFGERASAIVAGLNRFVFALVLFFVYYIAFEYLIGRTPGKLVFGTRVVSESGGPPSLRQIAIRTLARLIPFEPFSFFGERGWHDTIPKTRVVLSRS